MIQLINMINILYFIFINFLLLLKLLLYIFVKILLINTIISKIILLLMLTLIIILIKRPYKKELSDTELEKKRINSLFKYAIKDKKQHIYNIFIISIITSIIILGTFYLRILNHERILNLKEQYIIVKNLIQTIAFFENILNVLLFISIIILYFLTISFIIRYLKLHIIKRHIYLVGPLDTTNFYKNIIFEKILLKACLSRINIDLLINYIYKTCYFQWCKKEIPVNFDSLDILEQLEFKKQKPIDPVIFSYNHPNIELFLWHFLTKVHYVIFFIVFIYDLCFNNYQITLIFSILPWTLIYEFYVRFSAFIDSFWIQYDEVLHAVLYSKYMHILNEETLIIDGEYYNYDHIKMIYNNYVLKDFKKNITND